MNWEEFFKHYGFKKLEDNATPLSDFLTIEDLYQAFKARMEHEFLTPPKIIYDENGNITGIEK